MSRMILNPYTTHRRKEYYRFLTSGFIHADHMHLVMNMFSLYFLGRHVEEKFSYTFDGKGSLYYIAIYVLAVIVAGLPSYFKHKDDPGYNTLGASGGVSAITFAFILFMPTTDLCLLILCLPGFLFGSLYLLYSYFQAKRANDNINHDAHIFGALFGLLFCVVLHPQVVPQFFEALASWRWGIFQ
jgi:membrane associated rhomboid family serine protease